MSETIKEEKQAAGRQAQGEVQDLGDILDRVESAVKERSEVAFGEVMDHLGRNSFVPLLILPGLVMLVPIIGDMPGVPVVMGVVDMIVCVQMLMKRKHFWIPGWLENWSITGSKVERTVARLRRPAGRRAMEC